MSINERIRYLRENILRMSETTFAAKIGMRLLCLEQYEFDSCRVAKQIDLKYEHFMESCENIADITVQAICLTFNINERWLRYGLEPMYISGHGNVIDEFSKEYGLNDFDSEVLKAYSKIDPNIRKAFAKQFEKDMVNSASAHADEIPGIILEDEKNVENCSIGEGNKTVEEEEEEVSWSSIPETPEELEKHVTVVENKGKGYGRNFPFYTGGKLRKDEYGIVDDALSDEREQECVGNEEKNQDVPPNKQ